MDRTAPSAGRVDPDRDLVERLRAGDEVAFARVLDEWSGSMRRLAAAYVGSGASAEDVVQETWLAVLEHLASFEGRSSFKHWVYRILANTAKRRASRDRRTVLVGDAITEIGPTVDRARFQPDHEFFPGHWQQMPARWPSPEEAAESAEIRRVLADAVRLLPPRQAAVVTLRDIEGYGAEEAAELMGVSAANQRVLLHRGRAVVRAKVEEYLASAVTDRHPRDSGEA